ncbi:succinyldiaminopimelate aminotransferase apoenzyme [Okibacterium fritillariae]|uniref:Succinyldiaminopimelate aminotransferase apoenzyme n=2 Tax=Okibacterium fritillariae TaxID=123320 RepID=A0A1T5J2K2_9MICO|nr:succinyldiaminopimelate aminotransferase apoenzyme [Okibacterium fritillariae]
MKGRILGMDASTPWQRTARAAGLLGPSGQLSPTIFAEMSALASATGAINLGQGFPDEDGPADVLEAARRAIAEGANQYPPGRGIPDLRAAIAEHQQRFYGLTVDPEREICVTAGATEALAAAILAYCGPGDEIVVFEPYYDAYAALAGLSGAQLVPVPLRFPDFQPDEADIRAAVTDRTRLILVNTPHNPTGTVFGPETLAVILEAAERADALVVTDEVYEHLTFGSAHVPLSTLPGAAERVITISSAGKTFSTTGWKIGWVTASAGLLDPIVTVKQFLTYVNGAPFQPAIAAGLRLPDTFFEGAADALGEKRDILSAGLRAAGFAVSNPAGSYFVIADAAPLGVTDAADLCRRLPELVGVVGIPVSAFVSADHAGDYRSLIRFAFCKKRDVLTQASARLAQLGTALET